MENADDSRVTDGLLEYVRSRYFGKYRGIVTDNEDTTKRGRVKVRVPSVLGESMELWAMPCLPYAGENVGLYAIPDKDAGVWVEFEGGDPSFPIWTGGYWVDKELPKLQDGNDVTPSVRMLRTQKGLQLSFNDKSEVLTISDKDGKNIMTLDVQAGKIRLEASMKIVVQAPQIELVENASHPLAFGDDLLKYLNTLVTSFNTHVHPATLGPPPAVLVSPPMTPATFPDISMLSQKVKTN